MSVVDQSAPAAMTSGPTAFAVRLSAQFVNRLCARLQKGTPDTSGIAGLLFGMQGETRVILQAFKSAAVAEKQQDTAVERNRLEQAFEELILVSQRDPEVAALDLVGWYCVRPSGGLHASEAIFHNAHFRGRSEVALIVKPEAEGNLVLEFYARANGQPVSAEAHRWGALRLSRGTSVAGPVEITMQTILQGMEPQENPMRESLRPAEAAETERQTVTRKRIPLSFLRTEPKARAGSQTAGNETKSSSAAASTTSAEAARGAERSAPAEGWKAGVARFTGRSISPDSRPGSGTALQKIQAGPPPSVPAVRTQQTKQRLPWMSSAIVCAVMAAATFLFLFVHGLSSDGTSSFLSGILPDTGLMLRAEGQGDRLLLSWNRRNRVVRSAVDGVLHIDDGSQHRDVHLDAGQVENGLVLYRPASNDVTFRLEVRGQQGTPVTGTVRVLDGDRQPLDVTGSAETSTASGADMARPEEYRRAVRPEKVTVSGAAAAGAGARSRGARPTATEARIGPPILVGLNGSNGTRPADPNGAASLPKSDIAAAPVPASSNEIENTSKNTASKDAARAASEETDSPSTASPPSLPATSAPPAAREPIAAQTPAIATHLPLGSPQPTAPVRAPVAAYVPPRPLRQVLPDTTSVSPAMLASYPQVEVVVQINAEGKVTAARVVRGKNVKEQLVGIATVAAKQWTFRPATTGGRPVSSEHTILFQFQPAER